MRGVVPFLSSTVTVSFWHFIRNLRLIQLSFKALLRARTDLTSFMMAVLAIARSRRSELYEQS
jgi:hypothetical protein